MTPEDAERIRRWNEHLAEPVSLRLVLTRDPRSVDFEGFLKALVEIAPKVRADTESKDDEEPPAFWVGSNLTYHGLPEEGELGPFLEGLAMQSGPRPEMDESTRLRVLEVSWPAELILIVAPQCRFCPQVARSLIPLAFESPFVHLSIVDGVLFPEIAGRYGARSAPTVLLDDRFRWTGPLPMTELMEALVHRDPVQMSAQSMQDLLKEGSAGRLADMMLQQHRIFPAFLKLLAHPEWPVRLGAMVVVEDLAEKDLALAATLSEAVWELLPKADVSLRGDLIYLFGLMGAPEWAPRLEGLQELRESAELCEVMDEALEKMRGRGPTP